MTQEQFKEAARWTMQQIDEEEIEYNWYLIDKNHLYQLTYAMESEIRDNMDEWCNDNNINPEEWSELGNCIDVFCIE